MTQFASGEVRAVATVISGSTGSVYYARVHAPGASTFADLDPAYTAIMIPLSWDGRFVINGADVCTSSIHMPVDGTLIQVHGRNRETVAIAVRREGYASTIAALNGVDAKEVKLGGGSIKVPATGLARVRHSLASMLQEHISADRRSALPQGAHDTLTRSILETVTDLHLHARPAPKSKVHAAAKLARIVRKAEECFESAQSGPISLADLCAAAGVSQGTLYSAFMAMCGSSPMAHFKKRRLTDARLALLERKPKRRLVKSVALDSGLTHLGRFSAEYRELFGESPTTTLNRCTN